MLLIQVILCYILKHLKDRKAWYVHIYYAWCDIILIFKLHRRTRLTPRSSIEIEKWGFWCNSTHERNQHLNRIQLDYHIRICNYNDNVHQYPNDPVSQCTRTPMLHHPSAPASKQSSDAPHLCI